MKKKKKAPLPKARHVWEINPKERVKPSEKVYKRSKEKQKGKKKTWVDDVSWFGE